MLQSPLPGFSLPSAPALVWPSAWNATLWGKVRPQAARHLKIRALDAATASAFYALSGVLRLVVASDLKHTGPWFGF